MSNKRHTKFIGVENVNHEWRHFHRKIERASMRVEKIINDVKQCVVVVVVVANFLFMNFILVIGKRKFSRE